ncbi:hypothetical protein PN498_22245 [Oscillatoria sp. CS-180]|uniref:hypothetical protein n=1 Tax=Oscillatoria sp. CS-180 TaxID=3021720 RepID=UPI00232FB48C|nr:hypothetical protein [Oscillatoria sp. CS-180]MDB9528730.1 hypothetical protein [Oscillatoria sp. CS-180]
MAAALFPTLISVIALLTINRDKLRRPKLKIEVLDEPTATYRDSGALDLQINLRLQAIQCMVSVRSISLLKKRYFNDQLMDFFEKAVNIRGDLTKYSEADFAQFMACIIAESDCSKITEYESRFKEFFQIRDFLMKEGQPHSLTLLGRISEYDVDKT